MNFKFLVLSLLLTTYATSAIATDDNLGGGSTNGLAISLRSAVISTDSSTATEVLILNSAQQEVDRVSVYELDYYKQSLAAGEYTAVYLNSEGNELDQVVFLIRD